MPRYIFLGLPIDSVTKKEALEHVAAFIKSGKNHLITPTSAAKIVMAYSEDAVRKVLFASDLIIADGMGAILGSKLFGINIKEHIAGVDFMADILNLAAKDGYSAYFLGSTPEVVKKTVNICKVKYPALKILGWHDGYFSGEQESQIMEAIIRARPDVLLVGISSPKKEEIIDKYIKQSNIPVCLSVGGGFDIIAGKFKRAPKLMQRLWLEWFFRLIQEPRRLWKRHIKIAGIFLYLIIKYKFCK